MFLFFLVVNFYFKPVIFILNHTTTEGSPAKTFCVFISFLCCLADKCRSLVVMKIYVSLCAFLVLLLSLILGKVRPESDVVLFVSHSGNTHECVAAAKHLADRRVPVLVLTGGSSKSYLIL